MKLIAAFAALFAVVDAIELTGDNYDASVAGKTVFLKFYAPWYVVAGSQRSFLYDIVYTHRFMGADIPILIRVTIFFSFL